MNESTEKLLKNNWFYVVLTTPNIKNKLLFLLKSFKKF